MYRDALILDLENGKYLITTCDSCGSIGQKQHDVFTVDTELVAYLTARVAMIEAMSLNAIPHNLVLPIANEPEPTAELILSGIKKAMDEVGLDMDVLISTEKNMSTSMTAFGVVVNAISSSLLLNLPQVGDNMYMIGVPSVGEDVLKNQQIILNFDAIRHLLEQSEKNSIRQIIPAGSGGIIAEVDGLLDYMRCKENIKENIEDITCEFSYDDMDELSKSCGPATSALVFATNIDEDILSIPVKKIGKVIKNTNLNRDFKI